eukprot:1347970-Amorphochlora_amoeboformis.AAC.1
MTMLIESSKKTADGFRLISKENIVTKLDSTWTTHDEGERERLTMKAIGEMAARQMIAQDGDHVWEEGASLIRRACSLASSVQVT